MAETPWLTAREAAAYLRIGLDTFFRECRLRRIRHARVGGRRAIRCRREWLDEFLERSAPVIIEVGKRGAA